MCVNKQWLFVSLPLAMDLIVYPHLYELLWYFKSKTIEFAWF